MAKSRHDETLLSDNVDEWLTRIGLPQYRDAFRENDLEWDLVPDLDVQTLKDIGVTSAGHRMRILDAVRKLRAARADESPEREAIGADQVQEEPDRRQVTVMFCDLVGSTELSQILDPEDLREVMRAYQEACARAIERFEGFVARYMGDGVMSYFGYPRAFEDAAERAVLSGLAVIEAVAELDARLGRAKGIELAVRVGIATGPVVAGDLIGQGASQERSVVGETPNLAARLQTIAQPGTVAIAPETRALCAARIVCTELGVFTLKGIARPVRAWRAMSPAASTDRLDARADESLSAIRGREAELEAVLREWHAARDGRGRLVLLSGEPGIGKSRIVQAFRRRIAADQHETVRFQCSAHHANSALYPVINRLKVAAGFSDGDEPERQHAKLARLLKRSGRPGESAAGLFASLLSVPPVEGHELPELPPPVLKEQTLEALLEYFLPASMSMPAVIELEDAHWIDPSTQELMSMLIDRLGDRPALVLVTFRPEFPCPWTDRPDTSSIALDNLTRDESEAIVNELCGGRALPDDLLEQIVAKTDGVPLFVEELTKNVLESGLLVESDGRLQPVGELSSLSIPASLQDSLMARLDRLGPVKRLAQVGAAIGREFSRQLIGAATDMEGAALDAALAELVDSELVHQRNDAHSSRYQFKHALVQDAAYASLLRSRRQSLHLRLAEVYSDHFPEIAETQPEMLARHWSEGGRPLEAALCWLSAGKRASRRFSNEEALNHLNNGLALVPALPEGTRRDETELKLRVALGTVLRVRAGPGAEVTQENYNHAVALCERLPVSAEHFAAMWGKWVNAMNFKPELGLQWTERLQALATQLDDAGFMLQAHHAQWTTLFHIGRFTEAYSHTERGLGYYDETLHRHHAALYGGHDPRVCGRAFAAHALWMLGAFDRSLEFARSSAHWGRALDHAGSRLHVIEGHLLLYQFRREPEALAPWLDELDRICADNDLPEYRGKLLFNRGWLIASRGDIESGTVMMREGLENQRSVGSYEDIPMFSERLAETLAKSGETAAGLEMLDKALALADEYGYKYWLAEVHRRKGALLAQAGRSDAARESFRRALEIARLQGAKTLELRAETSLARLGAGSEDASIDADSVRNLIDSFTEDLDCVDLVEARSLFG